jgi:lysyl-tRNA synthetase class 2
MELNEVERERVRKIAALRAAGIDPYPPRTEFAAERRMAADAVQAAQAHAQTPEAPAVACAVMGRIVGKRIMGKAAFVHVEDGSGRIQLFARVGDDSLTKESFEILKDLDLGDFVEARGELMLTKTGDPSLKVAAWRLLSKAVAQLPIAKEEKLPDGSVVRYSAMSDPETRYRQRYADLAVNPEVREIFRTRARIIKAMREFLDDHDFLEVETPILQPIYGGAAARPFVTHHNQLDQDLYLRIAFELYLKRVVAGGIERVYEIGRDFRNEGVSFKHNPEFTMLEFYAAYMDMYSVMDLIEAMIQHIARRALPPEANGVSVFRGHAIHWLRPFRRWKLRDAILEKTGVDYALFPDAASLGAEVLARRLMPPEAVKDKPWGKIIDGLIGDYVEKDLVDPTFLYEYPRDISPFAKSRPDDPNTVERFEGFIGGAELCNAFSELNDPLDQEQRFLDESANAEGDEANPVDEDFLRAMRLGMPPMGGLGMGIDRLTMMFTGKDTIREVILFPHLRREE